MDASSTPWAPEAWLPEGPGPDHLPVLRTAICSAAEGRYRAALHDLERLDASGDAGAVSAGSALQASILRQLHDHQRAQEADQRALVHAIGHASSDTRVDALVGLAADAIEHPQLALERWAGLMPLLPDASRRARVRAGWVGAEVHLAAGRPADALEQALVSAGMAVQVSPRHLVKSSLVLGVCRYACGQTAHGIEAVRRATVGAADLRLRPLLWPGAYLLAGWLPAPQGRRWRGWAQDVVASIAGDLPADLLAGWRTDPAVRALLDPDAFAHGIRRPPGRR